MKEVKKSSVTPAGSRLILASVAAGCAAVLLLLPRPVAPLSGPSLSLSDSELGTLNTFPSADVELSEAATGALSLYRQQGEVEAGAGESREDFASRARRLEEVGTQLSEDDLNALRNHLLSKMIPALRGELGAEEENALLGSFPRVLERYGASRDGETIAPPWVLRALFMARFHHIFRLEPTRDFSEAEQKAYWGWLALYSEGAPAELRLGAANRLEVLGQDVAELRAWLSYGQEDYHRASGAYFDLSEATGSIRARNHALAAQALLE